jgi:RNA polymerase-binding transcription factor DksA
MSLRLGPEERKRLRGALMKRGRVLSTLLSEVLAGKQPPSLAAMMAARPGKRPEEVLRLALDQVEERRKLIDADDDAFGRCQVCGEDLGVAALNEVPWADRCHQHAGE